MKSQWSNFHQIGRNSFLAASTIYVSTEFNFLNTPLPDRSSFCFAAKDRSSFVVLKSEAEFNSALSKARDGSLPSVFYFTAAWCGPCRLLAPVILELSNKYPDVTTYKVDIDEGGLTNAIGKQNVSAVPTLQFFKGGVKKAEIVGVDVMKLRNLMEKLYK
ncbi:PREDICTED: thioredoxin O2, mitochondrial isoform X1 [Camelina sativa]|uniref:Thioredoxin O2, mitochondrial isoform X1 n=1 Tax=Camelina sativa TaxID=90675 RepID=A0ABM0YEA5_CAMSA|nr:PREDICTED: thioredoxin O2, mitochondrial isoform X1 [Camelina sativa]